MPVKNAIAFRPPVSLWAEIHENAPERSARTKFLREAWSAFVATYPDTTERLLLVLTKPDAAPHGRPFQVTLNDDLYQAMMSHPEQLRSRILRFALVWYVDRQDDPQQLRLDDLPEASSC